MIEIRVVLADDHPVVRAGLTALLGSFDRISVVGVAEDGRAAVAAVLQHRPDLVIVDLQMPGQDGLTTIGQLARSAPGVPVLVLTMFDDETSVLSALRAGAAGYLLKGAEPADIERTIRAVAAGDVVLGQAVAATVRRAVGQDAVAPPFPQLTNRERQVLTLLAEPLSNAAIGERLGLSAKTVANHLSVIFLKLGVADRTEALLAAREAGLGPR